MHDGSHSWAEASNDEFYTEPPHLSWYPGQPNGISSQYEGCTGVAIGQVG